MGGARVLELGSGTGLVAIALALAGADVVATDNSPQVLEGLEANVRACERQLGSFPGRISIQSFDWASGGARQDLVAAGPWDAIVGSDLVYPNKPRALADLLNAINLL